jgi:Mn-containing catalase
MHEPKVVVANREDLWWLLTAASQLEHMIMCQYLFAEFSLKNGTADGLTPEQAEAVERWRGVLRGIAVEEMLHLALVANLMAAIGGAPTFREHDGAPDAIGDAGDRTGAITAALAAGAGSRQ